MMQFVSPFPLNVRLDGFRRDCNKTNQYPSERRSYDSLLSDATDCVQVMWWKKQAVWLWFYSTNKRFALGDGFEPSFPLHAHSRAFSHLDWRSNKKVKITFLGGGRNQGGVNIAAEPLETR